MVPSPGLGDDASLAFARKVAALNDLAKQILAAKATGDQKTASALLATFRNTLAGDNLPALVRQAKADEMPSEFLLRLDDTADALTALLKQVPLYLGLGVALYLFVTHRGSRRREW